MKLRIPNCNESVANLDEVARAVELTELALKSLPDGTRIPEDYIVTGVTMGAAGNACLGQFTATSDNRLESVMRGNIQFFQMRTEIAFSTQLDNGYISLPVENLREISVGPGGITAEYICGENRNRIHTYNLYFIEEEIINKKQERIK